MYIELLDSLVDFERVFPCFIITESYFWNFDEIYLFPEKSLHVRSELCEFFTQYIFIFKGTDIYIHIWEIRANNNIRNSNNSEITHKFLQFLYEVFSKKFLTDGLRFLYTICFHTFLILVNKYYPNSNELFLFDKQK